MNYLLRYSFLLSTLISVTACANMPQLFWPTDTGGSELSAVGKSKTLTPAQARAPLELPPELRADIELPMAKQVAVSVQDAPMPVKYAKAVTGKEVALDARVYDATADQVFSAVVDAMTSLNLPVDSVDSPSGIVTSDWVRKGANNNNMLNTFMGRNSSDATRYRYIVRVYRLKTKATQQEKSRLEVRLLNQVLTNMHWRNRTATEKLSLELFSAVEDQLARMQSLTQKPSPQSTQRNAE